MEVSSEKLLAVSAAGPPAFFFPQKLTFLDFLDMTFFGKVCFWSDLLRFRVFESGNTEGPSILVWDLTF